MTFQRVLTFFLCLIFGHARAAGAQGEHQDGSLATFVDRYCLSCHDADTAKGGLSLESAGADFADARSAGLWIRVHDKLAAGDMPPKGRRQPAAEERRAMLNWLASGLHDASLARQQRDGRVVLRRLNRTEYEHTLRDLLGVPVNVKAMLPEEATVAGFDTVSRGLELSATHLIRYQQAADRAIDAALASGPERVSTTRLTGRQYIEAEAKSRTQGIDVYKRLEGDALIFYAQANTHGGLDFQLPTRLVPGRYKVRAKVESVNTGGPPVTLLFHWSGRRPDTLLSHIAAVKDAPVGAPGVVEVEVTVPAGGSEPRREEGAQISFFGWTLSTDEMLAHRLKADPQAKLVDLPGLAILWAEVEGPLGAGPSLGMRRMFGDLPARRSERGRMTVTPGDARADADRLMRAFLPLAFRRPVEPAVVDYFVRFVQERLDQGIEFTDAMRAGYRGVLCSPHFLLLPETRGPLDDYALASRLSYFLWKSPPDDALLSGAADGKLHEPQVLAAQVERVLNDPRSQRFVEDFADQWLDLRRTLAMKPDEIYREYDDQLAWSLRPETIAFVKEVLAQDLSVTSFVDSDWTFLNERLARHYGLYDPARPAPVEPPFPKLPMSSSGPPPLALSPPPARPLVLGMDLRRVALPSGCARGGLLTQASILKVTANGTTTSPVKRGAWVLDRILGKPPSPPPPNLPALEPDIRGATTIRQQLDKHRQTEACARCHRSIDPPGFALESFDVLGGWRDAYRVKEGRRESAALANYPAWSIRLGAPVELGDVTPDGRRFRSIQDYRKILLDDRDRLARNLAQKLITYGTGAEIQFADREVVEQIVRDVSAKGSGFRSLVHAIVQSRVFLNK